MMEQKVKDIIVETGNPGLLDQTIQQLPGCAAAVVGGGMPGGYEKKDGGYIVRCFNGFDFLKFAIERQGYGKIIKVEEI